MYVCMNESMKVTGTIASWALTVSLLLVLGYLWGKGEYLWALSASFIFALALLPVAITRRLNVVFPWELLLGVLVVFCLHTWGGALGLYHGEYLDKFMHFLSSALVALYALIIVVLVDRYALKMPMPLPLVAVLILIITMGMGAFWEIGEFLRDSWFGTRAQRSLADTMGDLVADLIGGGVAAVVGPLYIRTKRRGPVAHRGTGG